MKMSQKPEISNLRCCIACLKDESVICVENCNDSNIIDIYNVLVKGEIDQLGLPTLAICDFCTETLQLIIEFQKQCFKSIDSLKSKLDFIPEAIFIKEEEIDFDEVVQTNKIEMVFVEEEAKEQFNDSNTNFSSDDDEAFDETQPADNDESDQQSSEETKIKTEVSSLKNEIVQKKMKQNRQQCKKCDCSFYLISQLKRHMVKKHRGSSRCKYCSNVFLGVEEFKQHIQEEEAKRPSFFCEICSFSTKWKGELNYHITQDHMSILPRLICDTCGKGYSRRSAFKEHFIMNHTDKASIERYLKTPNKRERHQCTQCDASFHSPEVLKRHILKKHEGGSQCKYCLNVFWDKEVLKQHIQEEEAKRPSLFCEMCSFSTKWTKDLKSHISAHMSEVPKFICDLCGRNYKLRQGFKRHFVKYHNASKEHYLEAQKKERKRHQCKQCDSSYVTAAILKRHVMKRHQGGSICRYCHKIFVDKEEYEQHLREEEAKPRPDRTLCCEQCGYTTKWKVGLRSHIKKHHSPDQPPIICDICGKTYKLRGDFKQHFLTRHMEKTFQCGECGKTFSLNHELRKHMRNFHSPEGFLNGPNAIVECEYCNKLLKKICLKQHILIVHRGAKNHKCDVCEMVFSHTFHLKKHMKTHDPEHIKSLRLKRSKRAMAAKSEISIDKKKRVQSKGQSKKRIQSKGQSKRRTKRKKTCDECGLTFEGGRNLAQHKIATHMDKKTVETQYDTCKMCGLILKAATMRTHVLKVHINDKRFKCDQCDKGFNCGRDLKLHKYSHTGEHFKCNICSVAVLSIESLKRHFKSVHNIQYTMEDIKINFGYAY